MSKNGKLAGFILGVGATIGAAVYLKSSGLLDKWKAELEAMSESGDFADMDDNGTTDFHIVRKPKGETGTEGTHNCGECKHECCTAKEETHAEEEPAEEPAEETVEEHADEPAEETAEEQDDKD